MNFTSRFGRRIARLFPFLALALSAPLLLVPSLGCSGGAWAGNGFGATPGGVQDLGLARELVADGIVPPAAAFVVEGMFSEHDLPIAGGACERALCIRGAGAVAPDADRTPAGWVQLGLSSSIDPASFERAPATVVLIVDVSGSMGWGATDAESPGEISRALLHRLADGLGSGDDVALVTYGSTVAVPLPLGPHDAAALHGAVNRLATNGSTNLEAGLARGIEIARAARMRDASRPVRMMLFTDEQPNVGATSPAAFGGMVADAAEDDIGITVFGAGRGLGQEIFLAMSHLRGGNAFSLFRTSDVERLMDESWPWLMVPVAFDLHVEVATSEGLVVSRGHGFPSADGVAPTLDASTVFLSRRRGALLVELAGDAAALASGSVALSLSYSEPSGAPVEEAIAVTLPTTAAGESAFEQPATRSTIALALLVGGMRDAAEAYGTDRARAVTRMRGARERFVADAAASSDASLALEADFATELLALMEAGAPQR